MPKPAPNAILFEKDEAICLNVRPFSQTSQMVTWLTREHGCITTPIKGAQRPKSHFLGHYDVAYTCELVYYAHDKNGIHHIRECTPLTFRESLRADWRAALTAAYACDLTLRIAQPNLPNPSLFTHLENLLDALSDCPNAFLSLAALWYESNLLYVTGLMPDFTPPSNHPADIPLRFSIAQGKFIPPTPPNPTSRIPPSNSACRMPHAAFTISLHPEIPELFQLFLVHDIPTVLTMAKASTRTDDLGRVEPFPGIFGLRRFLGLFLNEHLDLLPGPRRTLLDLLLTGPSR